MRDFNLFHFLHPHLKFDEEVETLFEQIHHVVSWFDLLFLEERYERWLIYFYGLIDFLKEGEIHEVCQRLAMNEKVRNKVVDGKASSRSSPPTNLFLDQFGFPTEAIRNLYGSRSPPDRGKTLHDGQDDPDDDSPIYLPLFHSVERYETVIEGKGFDSNWE